MNVPPECAQLCNTGRYANPGGAEVALACGFGVRVTGGRVGVGVAARVAVFVGDGVSVGVSVGVAVAVGVSVGVRDGVGVQVDGSGAAASEKVGEGAGGLNGLIATRGLM